MYNQTGSKNQDRANEILDRNRASKEIVDLVAVLMAKINQLENDRIIQDKIGKAHAKRLQEQIDCMKLMFRWHPPKLPRL